MIKHSDSGTKIRTQTAASFSEAIIFNALKSTAGLGFSAAATGREIDLNGGDRFIDGKQWTGPENQSDDGGDQFHAGI